MNSKSYCLILLSIIISVYFYSCEIKEPTAPEWNVNLNLPFTSKSYDIFDIIKKSGNVGYDSLNNDFVYLYGESDYERKFGEDIKFDGYPETNINALTAVQFDTSLTIDDSTFILKADFLNGNLSFKFLNSSSDYSVRASIKNLFQNSDNDTARIDANVNTNSPTIINLNLENYHLKNSNPDNTLKMRIYFQSASQFPVSFSYELSEYSIKTFEGRLKPLNTGISTDEVLDPFGSDVPEGEINFASISPNKNFIILKKYSDLYQVDFANISLIGENKNGNRVRLKYLKYGNSGDPVDSIFTLTLASGRDSTVFPMNQDNSNILEFINNIPKKIILVRNDILNSSYQNGMVKYTDSLTIKLQIQVPLDISITKPIVFSDTVDAGISDESQRKELDNAKNLQFSLITENRIPLKAVSKILILDSAFNTLLAISKIVGNQPDSTVTVNAAPVGVNGFSNNVNTTVFSAELDSAQINLLKQMGKVIYEYKLYTDPNLIPPPLTTVKISGSNLIKFTGFGKLKYRINF